MKTVRSLLSIGLGFVFALTILKYFPAPPPNKVSYYTLQPTPLEMDTSNLALIGVGLASPKPKPSVMDATPAPMAKPVMMAAPGPKPMVMMAPKPAQPVMMAPKPAQPVMMVPPSPSS
jgi:hypothetical protein